MGPQIQTFDITSALGNTYKHSDTVRNAKNVLTVQFSMFGPLIVHAACSGIWRDLKNTY